MTATYDGTASPMKRRSSGCLRCLAPVALLVCGASATAADRPVKRFVASVAGDETLPREAREMIRDSWDACKDCDGEEFLTQGLAVLSEPFRSGLDAYDADQYGRCASIMENLRQSENPFIATNAAAYQIKALVALDRLLEAGKLIEELGAGGENRVATYSYFAAEVDFLEGYCLLGDLRYEEAEAALTAFLEAHPDSSPRLTLAARQMLGELANRQPGRIGEVVDLMTFAGRRLANKDSGDVVQARQQKILELLDRLIEEAEAQEQSGGGGSSGGSGGQQPRTPLNDSSLPGGKPQEGPLQAPRRANPGESWGAMPPAEREKILQALRDSFPGRYRRLVEQYYEEMAKKR